MGVRGIGHRDRAVNAKGTPSLLQDAGIVNVGNTSHRRFATTCWRRLACGVLVRPCAILRRPMAAAVARAPCGHRIRISARAAFRRLAAMIAPFRPWSGASLLRRFKFGDAQYCRARCANRRFPSLVGETRLLAAAYLLPLLEPLTTRPRAARSRATTCSHSNSLLRGGVGRREPVRLRTRCATNLSAMRSIIRRRDCRAFAPWISTTGRAALATGRRPSALTPFAYIPAPRTRVRSWRRAPAIISPRGLWSPKLEYWLRRGATAAVCARHAPSVGLFR